MQKQGVGASSGHHFEKKPRNMKMLRGFFHFDRASEKNYKTARGSGQVWPWAPGDVCFFEQASIYSDAATLSRRSCRSSAAFVGPCSSRSLPKAISFCARRSFPALGNHGVRPRLMGNICQGALHKGVRYGALWDALWPFTCIKTIFQMG